MNVRRQISDDGQPAAKRSATIQSVSIAFRFLDLLARAEGPLVLGEIARRGRTGTSTAHRYMRSLVQERLAAQDELGRYDLGPAALSIGVLALRRIEPVEIAARAMRLLSARLAASCGVAIWTERGPTIVRWYRSAGFTISTVSLGDVLPLDSTACGMVFQAHLPGEVITAARRRQPAAFRGTQPARAELAAVREAGIAELDERLFRQLTGKAAPVFNALGDIACVVTTVSHVDVAEAEGHRAALLDAARHSTSDAGPP
ncbi:IclR family transcriptional regulator [Methylorubrum zatmanii]|uniref:IclR family transcriptional regulator n=1 Tax=Methylorubrum zatmanii TaxID=29429 RepID=A0ABW1WHV0_9HYPH|nr:helix-turn-helix domain-containing protein [Methylorubrum zatmanii]MBD8905404.1 IclR family transcriptional regulator [Methylorubrum zatmanii]